MDVAKTTPQSRGIATDANGLLNLPGNDHRHAIIVSAPTGATITVQVGGGDGSTAGVRLNDSCPNWVFAKDAYGDGIIQGIRIQNAVAAPITIGIVEFLVAP